MTKPTRKRTPKRAMQFEEPITVPDVAPIDERLRDERATQDALFAARNRPSPNAPTDPQVETITPVSGPNVDGLSHLAILAHTIDDDERTLIATELDARPRDISPEPSAEAAKE
jgi:hypothetical protein